jgi:hypothetical protein
LPNASSAERWELAIINALKGNGKRKYSVVGSSYQNGMYMGVYMDEPLMLMRVVTDLKFIKANAKVKKSKKAVVGMLQFSSLSLLLVNCMLDPKEGKPLHRLKQLKNAFSEAVRKFDVVILLIRLRTS